jgi:hypothetical protein
MHYFKFATESPHNLPVDRRLGMRQASLASELSQSSPNKRSVWRHQCSGDPATLAPRAATLGFVRPSGGGSSASGWSPRLTTIKEQEVRFKQRRWLKSAGKPTLACCLSNGANAPKRSFEGIGKSAEFCSPVVRAASGITCNSSLA